ncbi:MAG: hypothetical protein AVDCRST_MAG15-1222, partial [uncultured Rubellimicrobium sp.]
GYRRRHDPRNRLGDPFRRARGHGPRRAVPGSSGPAASDL